VADRAETTITLTDVPRDEESDVIAEGLRAYNEAQAGYSDSRALAVFVSDPDTKKVVGGLLGRTSLGVVDSALSGAGFLPEAGLGGRRPDRLRAARPYSILYDQEADLGKLAPDPR
jgi:hypothetical protein